jgi:hypothetical protein
MKEIKQQLFEIGFKDSYPHSDYTMVRFKTENGNSFDVYLDPTKPNKVKCLRGHKPNDIMAFGLIGDFIGGKGKYPKFSFKTPKQLKEKLENWVL